MDCSRRRAERDEKILKWIVSFRIDRQGDIRALYEGVGVRAYVCARVRVRRNAIRGNLYSINCALSLALIIIYRSLPTFTCTSIIDKLDLDVYGDGHISATRSSFPLGPVYLT